MTLSGAAYNAQIDRNISKVGQAQAMGHILVRPQRSQLGYIWGCECGHVSNPTQSLDQARNNYRRHALEALAKETAAI